MQKFQLVLLTVMIIVMVTACNTDPDDSAPVESTPEVEEVDSASEETEISNGEILFERSYDEVGFACASCHHLTEARLIGPGLGNIAERVESYELDMTVEEYILDSITHPQEFIPEADPAYPENVMPGTYSELFTEEELNDLVSYVLSL